MYLLPKWRGIVSLLGQGHNAKHLYIWLCDNVIKYSCRYGNICGGESETDNDGVSGAFSIISVS